MSFSSGFVKSAKPRWVKEILKDRISENSMAKLKGLTNKVREVRPLGHGSEQVADLVVHPEHGLSVRKVPLVHSKAPLEAEQAMDGHKKRMLLWEEINKSPQGNFARLLGKDSKSPVSYFQYSKPARTDLGSRLSKAFASNQKSNSELYRLRDKLLDSDQGVPEGLSTAIKKSDKARQIIRTRMRGTAAASEETHKRVAELTKKFKHLHDFRPANVVGGKVVDLSPEMRSVTRVMSGASKITIPAHHYSKKKFLGSGTS